MASFIVGGLRGPFGVASFPTTRGRFSVLHMAAIEQQILPTDSLGTVTVSFSGVKAGSEIKLFDIDRTLLDGTESASGTPAYTLARYATGNTRNTIRALIISLGYEVLDFNFDLQRTNFTIPVFQRVDRNYRNP